MNLRHFIRITATLGVAALIAGCGESAPPGAASAPPSVPVAEVVVRPVTPYAEFTGSLTAVEQVELRPRVAGYIQDVTVPEGRLVEKGQQLFLIDPRVFKAAQDAARARLREAEAAALLAPSCCMRGRSSPGSGSTAPSPRAMPARPRSMRPGPPSTRRNWISASRG